MLKKTSRTDAVSKKAGDLWSDASDTLEQAGETVRPVVQDAVSTAAEKATAAAAAARPHVQAAAEAAQPHLDRLRQATQPQVEALRDQAGAVLDVAQQQTRAPRRRLRHSVQQAAETAAGAGATAYAALPEQAQQAVEQVAPKVKGRKRKGKLLIMTGLLLGGIAAYLLYQDRKAKAGAAEPIPPAPAAAPAPPAPAPERAAEPSTGEDLVGDVGQRADEAVTGSPRGRHAAGDD